LDLQEQQVLAQDAFIVQLLVSQFRDLVEDELHPSARQGEWSAQELEEH
jgi:hypothetical protein